jgi:pyrimidine operon attenuation protein/uracil phosphoribosyltransferase
VLLSDKKINIILNRLCYQLIERHGDFSNTILIGLQPRGTLLLDRLIQLLVKFGIADPKAGKLDTTFFSR